MGFPRRVRWFAQVALRLFILCSAAFLSAITAMRFAIQGREVEMPYLVGSRLTDAAATLGARGLGIAVADHVYSGLPTDLVVRQSPPAGIRVKVGQRAHVVVSLGPQRVSVPALMDKSLRAARLQLLSAGLQLGEVSSLYLPEAPEDVVMQQDPPPGNTGASTPRVALLVSLGPPPEAYVMPDLVGLTLSEARRRLFAAGLHVATISSVPPPPPAPLPNAPAQPPPATGAPPPPSGTVVRQAPPRGSRVDASTAVDLELAP